MRIFENYNRFSLIIFGWFVFSLVVLCVVFSVASGSPSDGVLLHVGSVLCLFIILFVVLWLPTELCRLRATKAVSLLSSVAVRVSVASASDFSHRFDFVLFVSSLISDLESVRSCCGASSVDSEVACLVDEAVSLLSSFDFDLESVASDDVWFSDRLSALKRIF